MRKVATAGIQEEGLTRTLQRAGETAVSPPAWTGEVWNLCESREVGASMNHVRVRGGILPSLPQLRSEVHTIFKCRLSPTQAMRIHLSAYLYLPRCRTLTSERFSPCRCSKWAFLPLKTFTFWKCSSIAEYSRVPSTYRALGYLAGDTHFLEYFATLFLHKAKTVVLYLKFSFKM